MVVVVSLLLWRSHRRVGVKRGEAQEQESFHQISAVGTILADAQNNAIAIQLLFGELQKRQERLLAGFVCQCLRQGHVQDVVVVIQNLKILSISRRTLHNKFEKLTESQLDEVLSVTLSLMVMRVGDFWATICEMRSSSSSLSLSVSPSFPLCFTSSSIPSSMNDN